MEARDGRERRSPDGGRSPGRADADTPAERASAGRHRLGPEVRRGHLVRLRAQPGQLLDHRGRAGTDRARFWRWRVRDHVAGLRALPGHRDRPADDGQARRSGRPAPRIPSRNGCRRGRWPARVPGLVAGQPHRGAYRHRPRHVGGLPGCDGDGPPSSPAAEPAGPRRRAGRAGHRRAGDDGSRAAARRPAHRRRGLAADIPEQRAARDRRHRSSPGLASRRRPAGPPRAGLARTRPAWPGHSLPR